MRKETVKEAGTYKCEKYIIVDYLKGQYSSDADKSREPYLTDEAPKIWDMILKHAEEHGLGNNDLLFSNPDGSIITPAMIEYRLEKLCKKIGTAVKRSHKIRKTVLSRLVDNCNINTARRWAGHSNESTTLRNYTFDRRTKSEKEKSIEEALCNQSVTTLFSA